MRDLEVLFQDAGDARLAFRRTGEGPALLLIHGWPLSGLTFRRIVPALSRSFTCYAVDLAGAGQTRWGPETDFSFRAQARRLKTFLDRQGIASCHVFGQDTGATIARALTLMDEGRVLKLVMTNTEVPNHRPPWIPLYRYMMYLPAVDTAFRLLLRSEAFVRSPLAFGGCFADPRLLEGDFHELFIAPLIASADCMQGANRYLRGLDWSLVDSFARDHARIRVPVLLVWGEDDPTFPIAEGRAMARQMPQCSMEVIPGARLLVHEEKPEAVSERVLAFLKA